MPATGRGTCHRAQRAGRRVVGIAVRSRSAAAWGRERREAARQGGAGGEPKRRAGRDASTPRELAKGWAAAWLETERLDPAGATAQFFACEKLPRPRLQLQKN